MTWKQRILSRIYGESHGAPLFVPRLDIWYNANKSSGTLPDELSGFSLYEVTKYLGVGFHSVIPDFVRSSDKEALIHRGLGFYNNPDFPYYADFSRVGYNVEQTDNELKVIYHTGKGDVTTVIEYGENFLKSGMSIPAVIEHAIKEESDYYRLMEIFSKVNIVPTPERYNAYYDRIGDSGIAVCFISLACGPIGHIQRDLRRMDTFFYDLHDYPSTVERLGEVLGSIYNEMIHAAVQTKAETAIFGANYDDMITIRPLFEKYFMPWLRKAGNILHGYNKYLLTHTDGENADLMESYKKCDFDIADSITPAPMTKLSLKKYRDLFSDTVTIWGGIPSVIMLENSMIFQDFKDFIEKMMIDCVPYNNLIFSIADTCPPQAGFDRIQFLCERLHCNLKK
jgi:hypothetical protein